MSTLVLAVIGALVLVAAVALSVLGSFAYLAAAAVGMFFVAAALIFNAARSPLREFRPFWRLSGSCCRSQERSRPFPFSC